MTPELQIHVSSRHELGESTHQNSMSTATRMHVMDMNLNQDKGLQSTSFTSNHSPLVPNYEGILRGGHFPARINPLNLVRVQN